MEGKTECNAPKGETGDTILLVRRASMQPVQKKSVQNKSNSEKIRVNNEKMTLTKKRIYAWTCQPRLPNTSGKTTDYRGERFQNRSEFQGGKSVVRHIAQGAV